MYVHQMFIFFIKKNFNLKQLLWPSVSGQCCTVFVHVQEEKKPWRFDFVVQHFNESLRTFLSFETTIAHILGHSNHTSRGLSNQLLFAKKTTPKQK